MIMARSKQFAGLAVAALLSVTAEAGETLALRCRQVHDGNGEVFEPGVVVVEDGKVVAVGQSPALPSAAKVVDCGEAVLSPGLIDAAWQLGTHSDVGFSEQSSEVIPHLHVADSVDLHSEVFETLAREGVTSVYVTPEAASVLGSQGALLKTGGAGISRLVDCPPSIKANLGPESSRRAGWNRRPFSNNVDFHVRRPTTRMGSTWVFRKAFASAKEYAELGIEAVNGEGHTEESIAALQEVLSGKVGLRFQARKAHDIHTAQRLCTEFGLTHILEYAQEAYECLELLAETRTPVIFGPLDAQARGMTRNFGDRTKPCLRAPMLLQEANVPFCLTACDGLGESGLARIAGRAVRLGMDREAALAAVSKDAAAILGVGDRLGVIAAGNDADLVLWNGTPLDDTSKPVLVLIDGQVAHDETGLLDDES